MNNIVGIEINLPSGPIFMSLGFEVAEKALNTGRRARVTLTHHNGAPVDIEALTRDEKGVIYYAINAHCSGYDLTVNAGDEWLALADPVGAAIADDVTERERSMVASGVDSSFCVQMSPSPQLSKVQQLAYSTAMDIAEEVVRQIGGDAVVITIEVDRAGTALFYRLRPANDSSRLVVLPCSATPLDKLLQIANLIISK